MNEEEKKFAKMMSAASVQSAFTDYNKQKGKNKQESKGALKKLVIVSMLCIFFMGLEFAGGYL
eukprot:CAMPEP_0168343146 /NCGR_PEP_ID=MMETSP0213-20121227/15874_1 /TAXON_ID=151035 /ORGANISM="Euplotes harpa, Strain FSP1.4" /LENGTH=62 /DNA_ID=CAMNT_0008350295 /DNA_START=12 /DNA_END=197 /DNA_ORIENTATION=+